MAFKALDTTGNSVPGRNEAEANRMFRELYGDLEDLPAVTASEIEAAIAAKTEIAALTAVATADGSDLATTQALANALKVAVNAITAALKA